MPEKSDKKAEIISILREHDAEQKDRLESGGAPAKKSGRKRKSPEFSIIGNGNIQVGRDIHVNIVQPPPAMLKINVEAHPGGEHIDDRQAARLMALVKDIYEIEAKLKKKPKAMGAIWSSLNAKLKVPSYRLIPFEDFAKAEKYLSQWIGRLNAMKSAPVVDGDAWRKRYYAYIKANSKHEPEVLAAYLLRIFNVTSLTQLDNDELTRVYRYVASRLSARRAKG